MIEYVKQNCIAHGVFYPSQKKDDIKYHIGTRGYRCTNIIEHFPKADHILGRWVRIIYNGQPDRQRQPPDTTKQQEIRQVQPKQDEMRQGSDNLENQGKPGKRPLFTGIREVQGKSLPNFDLCHDAWNRSILL